MNTLHHQPWSLLNEWRNQLNQLAEQQQQNGKDNDQSNVFTSQWLPAVDIEEKSDCFVLYADLPGVDPKNIEITMENGILSVKGERALETAKNGKDYSRVERAHGVFHRRFSLPETANPDAIQAHGEHGVLTITIPKQEKAQPRLIQVTAH